MLGYEDGEFQVGAMASIWAPSVKVNFFGITIGVEAHVGSVGAIIKREENGFAIGGSASCGAVVSISW